MPIEQKIDTPISSIMRFRPAKRDELKYLKIFLFEQGTNQWNYLPEDGIEHQFERLAAGVDSALVAVDNKTPVGLVIYGQPGDVPSLFLPYISDTNVIYISEVTVHSGYSGRGIGTALLNKIIEQAAEMDVSALVIDRHEENLASAEMMRKAGFIALGSFYDSARRTVGSQKTTVLTKRVP